LPLKEKIGENTEKCKKHLHWTNGTCIRIEANGRRGRDINEAGAG
jgi:hypothetical protein